MLEFGLSLWGEIAYLTATLGKLSFIIKAVVEERAPRYMILYPKRGLDGCWRVDLDRHKKLVQLRAG